MKLLCHRGERHEYEETERGIKLFSVSQVRKMAYDPFVGVAESILENARKRGSVLHRRFAFALYATEGLCAYPAVIEEYEGYCKAMDTLIRENEIRPVKVETPSLSLKFGYAGTPDGKVLYGSKRKRTLGDLKTGEPQPTDIMQLLAYEKMDGYEDCDQLMDWYLHADGTYTPRVISKSQRVTEWVWFINALGNLQSRANHGLK